MARKVKSRRPRRGNTTINMFFTIKNPRIKRVIRKYCHKKMMKSMSQRQRFAYEHLAMAADAILIINEELQWNGDDVDGVKDSMINAPGHRVESIARVDDEEPSPQSVLRVRRQPPPPIDSTEAADDGEELEEEEEDNATSPEQLNSSNCIDGGQQRIISQSAPLERNANPGVNSNNAGMAAPSRPHTVMTMVSNQQLVDIPVAPRQNVQNPQPQQQYIPPNPPQQQHYVPNHVPLRDQCVPNPPQQLQQYQQNYSASMPINQGRMPQSGMVRNMPNRPPRQMLPPSYSNYNNVNNNNYIDPSPPSMNSIPMNQAMGPPPMPMMIPAQMAAMMSMPSSSSTYNNNPFYSPQMR